MNDYAAPLADIRFALAEIAGMAQIEKLPGFEQATPDLVDAVMEEAGKLASQVLAPLNRVGDLQGSRLENGIVRTPDGFKEAYARYVEGGWNTLTFPSEYGGQGLPFALSTAVGEMWTSANMAFNLCPMLGIGAAELLLTYGTEEQKKLYLNKLVSGEWTGTMNLTEPQAGSDIGALQTKAVRHRDHYRITGTKIFITYGDHDMAPNVIHLVLARLPDAPAGSRGISLFLVPKFHVTPDGKLGARNDVRVVSLEHKLGIHASPTCVMSFGDAGGAAGYLVGLENRGLECIFTMMNSARFNVGMQGVGIGERAYQQARDFARQRVQGRPVTAKGDEPATIVHHPDVRRMLLSMRADTDAMRALAYYTAGVLDHARRDPDSERRTACRRRADFLIPLVKAWNTEIGFRVASTCIQIHGGMGYIEETGAAQHLRDVRIAAIYEGTNGIQANDLIGRKLLRDDGTTAREMVAHMRAIDSELAHRPEDDFATIRRHLHRGIDAFAAASEALLAGARTDYPDVLAGAVPYLDLAATLIASWLMTRGALAAARRMAEAPGQAAFYGAKIATARFFAEQRTAVIPALLPAVTGGRTIMEFDIEQL